MKLTVLIGFVAGLILQVRDLFLALRANHKNSTINADIVYAADKMPIFIIVVYSTRLGVLVFGLSFPFFTFKPCSSPHSTRKDSRWIAAALASSVFRYLH